MLLPTLDISVMPETTLLLLLLLFLTLVLNSQGMKKLRYAIQKSTKIKLK